MRWAGDVSVAIFPVKNGMLYRLSYRPAQLCPPGLSCQAIVIVTRRGTGTADRWWRGDRGWREGRRHDCLPFLGEESGQGSGVGRAGSPRCSPWWSRFFPPLQVLLVLRLAASERRSIVLLPRRSTAPGITAAFQGSARNRWRAGSPPRTRAGRLSMLGSGTQPGSRWSGDRKSFRRRSG